MVEVNWLWMDLLAVLFIFWRDTGEYTTVCNAPSFIFFTKMFNKVSIEKRCNSVSTMFFVHLGIFSWPPASLQWTPVAACRGRRRGKNNTQIYF